MLEIFSVIFVVFTVGFLTWTILSHRQQKNLPPGPPKKVLLGNINLLTGTGTTLINNMINIVKNYGDNGLCTIYVGNKPIILITDLETLKKVVNDDNFTGRPRGIRDEFFHRKGLIFTDGELWREQRRFALSTLRDLGMGKNWLQELIVEEAKALVEDIKSKENLPINPAAFFTTSVSNVICAIAYGKRFDHNDEKFRRLTGLIGQNVALNSQSKIMEFFPWLRHVPFSPFRTRFLQLRKNKEEVQAFLRVLVNEHQEDFHPGDKTDYINSFMNEALKQQDNPRTTFTSDQLDKSVLNLFGAGTETTSTTLAWAVIYLTKNPLVYEKVRNEVDKVVPDGGFPNMEEKDSLPYLQATIMEVQRMANLVPIAVRCNIQATEVNGYSIPANTPIFPFLSAVHMDERYFPEPFVFNPDRHLDLEGKIKKVDGFIPFSIGKRYCIGESLAKMELYIFLTSLVKHFTITLPAGEELSTNDSNYGLVNAPKSLRVVFQSR